MAEITVEIPEDLEFIRKVSKSDWSLLVTKILKEKIETISKIKKIASKSKLTEKDVIELSDKVNKGISKHYY